ncbi:cytochrome P450 [Macrolepiota fuliginosa MF-IS2]|uniref:Cytochrome P450 n=1 Tax=Macrolepiota fuliginosa MF-IS2 TaxID=1400762 RepID=A0A9P5XIK2_9AGAR|nr:cytochrome P450 [Macrolepiota fuliginosa MF-IS2]
MSSANVLVGLTALVLTVTLYLRKPKQSLPLPPGPKKWPVIGNLLQLPTSFEWETYARWSEIYGSDILHVDAAGSSIIIVNSWKAAYDLFEKKSSLYSSRADNQMVALSGWDWLFGFMPYGEAWLERRKLFQRHFHPLDNASHHPREREYISQMLRRLLDAPEDFMDHMRHMMGAITLSLGYGIDVKPQNDPNIRIADEAVKGLAGAANFSAFLVNSIPALKYVPSWFPGAGWKRQAEIWYDWTMKMRDIPFEKSLEQLAEGTATPSLVTNCVTSLDESKDREHQLTVIKDTAGNFFVGGADTTVSAINTFLLMMVCHPDIQIKAQQELDRVIGNSQLPDFSDEAALPYVSALVKETLRYQAITPFAIPHYLSEDDEYNGFFLPKGSVVLGNAWAILHDQRDYPNPLEFKPERFLKDGKLDPRAREPTASFGFGRRICPGRHIAISSLYLSIASILSAFKIEHAIDDHGNVIEPSKEYISSLILHPAPFKCSIKPRSQEAEALVKSISDS